jgi:hypothetical protein
MPDRTGPFEIIEVRGGESSQEAIPIGAVGVVELNSKVPVRDDQNKNLESLEVKV